MLHDIVRVSMFVQPRMVVVRVVIPLVGVRVRTLSDVLRGVQTA
jgi:hypothetical protein